jgi:hypothetical protein
MVGAYSNTLHGAGAGLAGESVGRKGAEDGVGVVHVRWPGWTSGPDVVGAAEARR